MSETKTIKVNDDFQSAFDGLMLGDGCVAISREKHIKKSGKTSLYVRFYYSQLCKHKDWLESLKSWFLEHNFSSKIYQHKYASTFSPNGSTLHFLTAHSSRYFKEQRLRWYSYIDNEGWEYEIPIKTVPEDIVLSSKCVANWFMGDGHYNKHGYNVGFSTQGFSETDTDYLCDLLEYYVGIGTHKYKHSSHSGYVIYIVGKTNVIDFVDYIRPHIHPVYRYKIGE